MDNEIKKILLVDDEESVRYSFRKLFKSSEYEIIEAQNGTEALENFKLTGPNLVVLDLEMPGMKGLEVLQKIKQTSPHTPVVIITAYGTSERVITAMKYGAHEYLEKPFDVPRLREVIEDALRTGNQIIEAVKQENKRPADHKPDQIVGNSHAIKEVFKMIGRVAASDANILLVGESGTGKELVARAIYRHSDRTGRPFMAINCAAIPDTLLESELFGHEKGTFTGADSLKIGKFEQADKGVLFLDEIGDMSLPIQSKLLRVLQDGSFERLGSNKSMNVDVRIIAATNKNLESLIVERKFREDLYYRLKVITITLPPLRMRKEDIPLLAEHFISRQCLHQGKQPFSIRDAALDRLTRHNWPGNIRELENVVKRAVLLCKSRTITVELITLESGKNQEIINPARNTEPNRLLPENPEHYEGRLYNHVMDSFEKQLIEQTLELMKGNQVKSARLLGISRVMLHDRMQKYNLTHGSQGKKVDNQ